MYDPLTPDEAGRWMAVGSTQITSLRSSSNAPCVVTYFFTKYVCDESVSALEKTQELSAKEVGVLVSSPAVNGKVWLQPADGGEFSFGSPEVSPTIMLMNYS